VREQRQGVDDVPDPRRELPLVHERLQIGVLEQVRELALDVPVVDVHPHRPQLEHGPEGLDPLDRVVGVDPHVVAGSDPVVREVVREAVGALLHLGVGAALTLRDQVLASSEVVGGVLEQVSQVELHRAALYEPT